MSYRARTDEELLKNREIKSSFASGYLWCGAVGVDIQV